MKSRKIFPRLTPLVLAALLLNFAHASAVQRRRRPARTPARPAAAPPQTQAAPAPTTPSPSPTTPAPQTQPVPADAQARRPEPASTIEEVLSADGYGVYAEVRRVGTLARAEELRSAMAMLTLLGDEVRPATQPVTDLFNFVSANADALAEARAVLAFMPTRAGLPATLVALELPSAETAAAFEPKFRRLVGQESDSLQGILGTRPSARGLSARRPAPGEMTVRGAARSAAERGADAQSFAVKRYGRLLLAADSAFTLKRLRGEEGAPALADNARFQSVRSRFSSDSVFVYVDTTLAQQGYAVEQQKAQEAREKQQSAPVEIAVRRPEELPAAKPSTSPTPGATPPETAAGTTANAAPAPSPTPAATATPTSGGGQPAAQPTPAPSPSAPASPEEEAGAQPTPTPEQQTDEERAAAEAMERANAPAVIDERKVGVLRAGPSKPSEEQVTVQRMGGLMRSLWEGAPRIPGAVALGLKLEGGSLAIRLAVENTPDGVVSIIPFLPNVVAGPPVTADAAQVAPDDGDIFFSASLDWTQIYNNTLGTASLNPQRLAASWEQTEEGDVAVFKPGAGEKVPTADEAVAAAEKLFRFSFREDLLPALGNEVAVSVPLKSIYSSPFVRGAADEKKEGKEADSEPGIAFIVTLNNPDKIREILPRVLTALDFVSYGSAFAPPEKREGFEVRSTGGPGGLSYAVIDNFLVLAEGPKVVRHVVDSYAARRTLAASQAYRDSTEWQARQKLAQIYVSEELMRSAAENTRKISGGSTDPVVRGLLAQLDLKPEPASYAATNEGDAVVHELRVPVSLIKVEAVSLMIGVRDARAVSGEMMAIFALNQIAEAENSFRREKKKERYGTLEELIGEQLVEKDFVAHLEYNIELSAVGDRFEVKATPKNYGKTGRRSFFVDENGTVRGADHKGEPASADDPPIN